MLPRRSRRHASGVSRPRPTGCQLPHVGVMHYNLWQHASLDSDFLWLRFGGRAPHGLRGHPALPEGQDSLAPATRPPRDCKARPKVQDGSCRPLALRLRFCRIHLSGARRGPFRLERTLHRVQDDRRRRRAYPAPLRASKAKSSPGVCSRSRSTRTQNASTSTKQRYSRKAAKTVSFRKSSEGWERQTRYLSSSAPGMAWRTTPFYC